jgi:hypothetical protein
VRLPQRTIPLLLAISGLVFGQAVSNPGQPTSTPNQINVTNSYLYLNKMHYAGGWVGTTPYNAQDVVTYSGSSYVSLQAGNLGQSPATAFTYWAALGGGSGAVASVFGRTGVVAAAANDYSTSLVGEGSNLYFTAARAVAAMAGLYQGPIAAGSTAQYFRGDLSLATFPTNLSSFTNGPGYITSNAVASVFGRTGAVVATSSDYSTSLVSEGTNLYFTSARVLAAMAGLYQGPISVGSTAQYFRGDLSLATFPTNLSSFTNGPGYLTSNAVASVFGRTGAVVAGSGDYTTSLVSEGTNLYFTNARAVAAMAGLYQGPITTGSTAQYFRGDLSLATFPTNLSSFTNGPGYLTANAVTSVFGRTGAVAAAANDYSFAQLSGAAVAAQVPANVRARAVGWSFSGGGSALTAQTSGAAAATFACTISAWTLTVDTGTATIDVWKIATGTAIPTVANTITASAVPAIASGTALRSTTLTGWTTSVAANDILVFKLSAVASATLATLVLECDQ